MTLPTIFDVIIPVTPSDARFVAWNEDQGFQVSPGIDYFTQLQFSTPEQANAIKTFIESAYPGSDLKVVDNRSFFDFPGLRKLQYMTNYGPKVLKITGTIMLKEAPTPTEFNVGWFINVKRILSHGDPQSAEAHGLRPGIETIQCVNDMGLAQPFWCAGGAA